jgi:hypothetical protein
MQFLVLRKQARAALLALSAAVALGAGLALGAPAAADPALDALVAAYPDHLAGYDATDLIWKDGTRMPLRDGKPDKPFDELLETPSILDQFAIPYRLGKQSAPPALNEDPGRIRNEAFFRKMYGDCRAGEVTPRLQPVAWLPRRHGGTPTATTVNGVAARLATISRELDKLPAAMTKFMAPSSGIYNCRVIAATDRLSVHAFGAAIDLNAKYGDYWLWTQAKSGSYAWKNSVPPEIVAIFEQNGFIWGGKWFHYDTMHFEYRPEIIELAKKGWPAQ